MVASLRQSLILDIRGRFHPQCWWPFRLMLEVGSGHLRNGPGLKSGCAKETRLRGKSGACYFMVLTQVPLAASVSHVPIQQENTESDSAKLEPLGNSKIAWNNGGFIDALRNASDIDSQQQAHGRTPSSLEALGQISNTFKALGSASEPVEL